MSDLLPIWVMMAISAVVILYIMWLRHRDQLQWQRKQDQQDLLFELQRGLHAQEMSLLTRCREVNRKLDEHYRILRYLAKRLAPPGR